MLKARVITALLLIAGFMAVLFLLPPNLAGFVFVIVAALGAWEWAGLMQAGPRARALFVGLVIFSCLAAWAGPADAFLLLWSVAALFWIVVAPLWLLRGWRLGSMGFVIGWILLVPTWAALVSLHGRNPQLLLAVMATVWVADIAAYFTGRTLGRHKLAPTISPGKTWEGVAGAMVGAVLFGVAASVILPALPAINMAALTGFLLLFITLSIMGDLFESLVKRQAGMKDSSQLLPGHGGILDRIDSLTSTLPLAALCLYWWAGQ
jgi:phosphatidate cytidylyltransferase